MNPKLPGSYKKQDSKIKARQRKRNKRTKYKKQIDGKKKD